MNDEIIDKIIDEIKGFVTECMSRIEEAKRLGENTRFLQFVAEQNAYLRVLKLISDNLEQ